MHTINSGQNSVNGLNYTQKKNKREKRKSNVKKCKRIENHTKKVHEIIIKY